MPHSNANHNNQLRPNLLRVRVSTNQTHHENNNNSNRNTQQYMVSNPNNPSRFTIREFNPRGIVFSSAQRRRIRNHLNTLIETMTQADNNLQQIELQFYRTTETEISSQEEHGNHTETNPSIGVSEERIDLLSPITINKSIISDTNNRNCVICMTEFIEGEKGTFLPCVHLFHVGCIREWLKTHNQCPICKNELQ